MATPPDIHEWISFDEVDEQRTWVFDATYLRSNYTCIFGCGCKGILDEPAPELGLGCCSFGAHFVDDDDIGRTSTSTSPVSNHGTCSSTPGRAGRRDTCSRVIPTVTATRRRVTRLVEHDGVEACIFLNRPGFEGGAGCALHIAALEADERPLDWKPSVCWQVPIRLEHSTDESGHLTSRLREWKRRDWGEGGADFGWWCTDTADAFVGAEPLYVSAKDDIVELVGARVYDQMVELLERPGWVPLPHPVLRRS